MASTPLLSSPSSFILSTRRTAKTGLCGATAMMLVAWLAATPVWGQAHITELSRPISFAKCTDRKLPSSLAQRAQCGSITVEENREQPNGRTITLPIVRISSSAKVKRDPIFLLDGGPGGSNLGSIAPVPKMSAHHDIYYVGYRGADGASAMTCPEFKQPLSAPKLFDKAALENIALAGKACAARLQAAGNDLMHYSMFDVIEDMEQVRAGIGAAKINLFSISYGTRVAQFYARRHPGSIARSAMFGANPPGHFVFSAHVNDQVLDRLTALCAADKFCAPHTSNLGATIRASLKAGERSGNPALDDARTQIALFTMLFSRDSTAQFVAAAIAAEKGDLGPLAQGGPLVGQGLQNIIFGDLFAKGSTDVHLYPTLSDSFAATDKSMGSPMDVFYMTASKYWPIAPFPAKYTRATYDRTPTLVVNGDLDVSTPLLFVQAELMPYLPNGKLVVLKDYGHSDFVRQLDGIDAMVAKFYADGTVDTSSLKDDPYSFAPQ